jgi:hypothetical protein
MVQKKFNLLLSTRRETEHEFCVRVSCINLMMHRGASQVVLLVYISQSIGVIETSKRYHRMLARPVYGIMYAIFTI